MLQIILQLMPLFIPLFGGYAMKVVIDRSVSGFAYHFNEIGGFKCFLMAFVVYLFVTQGGLKNFLSAPANSQVVVIFFFIFCGITGYTAFKYKNQRDKERKLASFEGLKNKRITDDDLVKEQIKINKDNDYSLIFLIQKIDIKNEKYYTNLAVYALKRANYLEINKKFVTGSFWQHTDTLFSTALRGGHLVLLEKIIDHKFFDPLVLCTSPSGWDDYLPLHFFLTVYPDPDDFQKKLIEKLAKRTKKSYEKRGFKMPFFIENKLKKLNINI